MVTKGSASRRRVRRLLVSATAACMLAAVPTTGASALSPAAPAHTAKKSSYEDMSQRVYQQRLLYWINKARDHQSKRSVSTGECVDGFADRWARRLANRDQFFHQDLGPIMYQCGLSTAGEILAMGGVTPRQMVRMWLRSPGHRSILLDRSYRVVGVGAKLGDNGAWYGCIDFGRH